MVTIISLVFFALLVALVAHGVKVLKYGQSDQCKYNERIDKLL